MSHRNWRPVALSLIVVGSAAFIAGADQTKTSAPHGSPEIQSAELEKPNAAPEAPIATVRQPPTKPKDLSDSMTRGLAYLISQQAENGGFGQGGGWRSNAQSKGGRVEGADVKDPPDVGNTCIAALALIRAGNTPQQGPYTVQLRKAVEFIETHVEQSDQGSLYITPVRDTQLQTKIGQYVDTFLAALVLTELKGQMPDSKSEERLVSALNKTIGKIESNQQADGTFAGNAGWASVLSQGLCTKALNRAFQKGVKVKTETIKKDLDQSVAQLDPSKTPAVAAKPADATASSASSVEGVRYVSARSGLGALATGTGVVGKGDAGVSLYSLSANAGRVQDAVNSNSKRSAEARLVLSNPIADETTKDRARRELKEIDEAEQANQEAAKQIRENIVSARFVKGFGNNGGEEFLSYMNIGEALFVQGGHEWEKWDRQTCELMNKAQNQDGSWSGHHCITGRTFCTSTALLAMMTDRTPLPATEAKPVAK